MKKITCLATICGIMLLGLSSCQKENLGDGQFTATITQMNNDGKVAYDGTGFAWQSGDEIVVFRQLKDDTPVRRGLYSATLSEEGNATRATFNYVDNHETNNNDVTDNTIYAGKFYAIYPYAIAPVNDSWTNKSRVRLPSTQTVAYNNGNPIIEGFPMYAECMANNRLLKFKNLCGLLKLHLEKSNTTVSTITISTQDGALNGLFNIIPTRNEDDELVSATLSQYGTPTDEQKAISVQFPAQNIANGKDFFIYLPAREYATLTITITDNTGKVCTKSLNSTHTFHVGASEWSSITLGNNDLVFEEVVVDEVPGSLPGLFSVGVSKQVVFSKGNLQYRPSDNTYRFADHQYSRNSYVSSQDYSGLYDANSTDWIEYFPWGTSGYDNKYPYYYSATASNYGRTGSYPLTGVNANYDWGVYNPISNGGETAGMWRTLTKDEWQYLFATRSDAGSKWTKATVGGVNGTIILPDSWTLPSGINMTMASKNWTNNQYTSTEWETLEAAGAVFLPTTGYLNYGSSNIQDYYLSASTTGYYWSATNSGSSNAYYLTVSKTANSYTNACTRGRMLAVRLVHDID